MKKIISLIVILLASHLSYSQMQRNNNFQQRGMVDRDQIKKRLEMRNESLQTRNNQDNALSFLNLSDEQKKKFKEINSRHNISSKSLKKEIMRKKLEMQLEKIEDNIDINSVNKLIDDMSDLVAELKKSEFKKTLELSSILDDEQKIRFQRLMMRKRQMEKSMIMKRNSRI